MSQDDSGAMRFEVGLRQGVWHVVRDGEVFGTYRGRASALAAARDAARLPLSRATPAQVVLQEDDA